jgi:DNA-directed RNA polymerase specialized sigma subunit
MDEIKDGPLRDQHIEDVPQTRAAKDIHLWNKWKSTNSKSDLKDLLRAYDPVIHKWVSQFAHSGVPYPALEAETKLNTIKAFQSYDPAKGTQLNTHVTNYLQKGQRLVYESKALTRIPEHRATRVSTFMSVKDHLKEKLNREPTVDELQEELAATHPIGDGENHWSPAEIARMTAELHKTLLTSEDSLQEMAVQTPSEDSKLIDYVYYELLPQEKAVFEYLTGRGGKPMLDGINIAKKLNLTPSRVSRIRQKIADKFEEFREK